MPTAAGVPIFEDLVALLQSKPSPIVLAQHMDVVTGAVVDIANRVRNLEHSLLVSAEAARVAKLAIDDQEKRLQSLEADRTEAKTRIDAVEKAPIDDKKRLDDLETRVRTVEGAVGSTNFAAAKSAPPADPLFKGPAPTDPIAH